MLSAMVQPPQRAHAHAREKLHAHFIEFGGKSYELLDGLVVDTASLDGRAFGLPEPEAASSFRWFDLKLNEPLRPGI